MDGSEDFVREVRDTFLLCKLCDGEFTKPKTLPCMHSFCQECLIKYAEESRTTFRYTTYCKPLNCPVCRRRTDITKNDIEGLPDNFLISSLTGIIRDKAKDCGSCDICTRRSKAGGRRPAAVQRCLDCDKQLCKRCVIQHQETKVTQHHSLFALDSVSRLMCSEHEEEAVRFICKTCSKCVCVFCTYTGHKGHDLVSILEGTENYHHEMEKTMESCNSRMESLNTKLKYIQTWERCYNETREHVLTTAAEFLNRVEVQRQAFLDSLDKMYGDNLLEIMSKKDAVIESLEGLSSMYKYRDNMPDNQTLEAVLIQSELQNKVRALLDQPLPVPEELPDSDNLTISFEKGGVSLGTLIKQNGDEEPIYYDGFEADDDGGSWCRQCRARSRSQSLAKEMPELIMQHKQLGGVVHSLTPLRSDTDISLTDVSALDCASPQLTRANTHSSNCNSMSSDLDKIAELVDQGIQVEMNPVQCQVTSYTVESEDIEVQCELLTDVAMKKDMKKDVQNRGMQCVADMKSAFTQSLIRTTCDSSCQYDKIKTKNSNTQYQRESSKDAITQYEGRKLQTTETQYEVMTKDSYSQHEVRYHNMASQPDTKEFTDSSSQYDHVTTCDKAVYFTPPSCSISVGTSAIQSADAVVMTTKIALVDAASGDPMDQPCIGIDESTNTEVTTKADSSTEMAQLQVKDMETMTKDLIRMIDEMVSTEAKEFSNSATSTDVCKLVDMGTLAYREGLASCETQTEVVASLERSTNTAPPPKTKDSEVNTVTSTFQHQFAQTAVIKLKTRGVSCQPEMTDFTVDVKPLSTHSSTQSNTPALFHLQTQTDVIPCADNSTNTVSIANVSRGVSAHTASSHVETTTDDLNSSRLTEAHCQTDICDSRDFACGDNDVTFEVPEKRMCEIICGPDIPFYPLSTSSTNTPSRKDCLRDTSTNTVVKTFKDSCNYPMIREVSSKASGTDRIKHRNVGLYVKPVAKDISTSANLTSDKKNIQTDTAGLTIQQETATTTDQLQTISLSTQTALITKVDNYTLMSEAFQSDKWTNTPNQLPPEAYASFSATHAKDTHNRWEDDVDLQWAAQTELSQTAIAALQQMFAAAGGDGSMSQTNSMPNPATILLSQQGSSISQYQSKSSASDSHNHTSSSRSECATKPGLDSPKTRDQSTSTSTLSSLLHTERLSNDTMDNKISECITKLRLVTKKLQSSTTDINRSQQSAASEISSAHDHDDNESVTSMTSATSLMADTSLEGSRINSTPNSSIHSASSKSNPTELPQNISTHPHTRSHSGVVETSEDRNRSAGLHRRAKSDLEPQLCGLTTRSSSRQVLTTDFPVSSTVSIPDAVCNNHNPARLNPSLPESRRLRVTETSPAIQQMVKTYNKDARSVTTLPEPGVCYAKLVQNIQSIPPSGGGDANSSAKYKAKQSSAQRPGQTVAQGAEAAEKLTRRQRNWDLKSLVQEEDRIKKQMRRSRENSTGSEHSRVLHSRRASSGSSDSVASSTVINRRELPAASLGSLYGSTDSLNQLLAGRGPRKAPKVAIKLHQRRGNISNSTASARGGSPALFTSKPNISTPPSTLSSLTGSPSEAKGAKPKARTRTIEPATLLGDDSRFGGESDKSKSVPASTSTASKRVKSAPKPNSARSLVSTVVKKVQSMGRGSLQKTSSSSPQQSSDSEKLQQELLPTSACNANHDNNNNDNNNNNNNNNADYPLSMCGERLAHHDKGRADGSPCLQPKWK